MTNGYIYILINPALEKDLLKIGKTTKTPEERAAEISSSTGVATGYYVAYEAETDDCHRAEVLIHEELAKYRYNINREFFKIPLKKAIPIVENIASKTRKPSEDEICEEGEDSEYKRAETLNDLGTAEYNAGNYEKAIEAHKEAISIRLDFFEAYADLGADYYMIGLNEDSEKAVRKALSINPRHASALSTLGAIFYDAKLYDEAIKVLKEAISIAPNNPHAYNNLAAIYFKQKRYDESIMTLKEALRISPEDPGVHFNLGVCYCEMDKPNMIAALKHQEILIRLDKHQANELEKIMYPLRGIL